MISRIVGGLMLLCCALTAMEPKEVLAGQPEAATTTKGATVLAAEAKRTAATPEAVTAAQLAQVVTIYRDEWGVPHVFAKNDCGAVFGMGYAQAEDNFWQLEENCIRAVGRYAEIVGTAGLQNDLLNHTFEIARRSRQDYARIGKQYQSVMAAYVAGINHYLRTHPDKRPRLIPHFEPWHVLAMDRNFLLDFAYGYTHLGRPKPTEFEAQARAATGSNAWAIGPAKTKSGHAMLLANPHQPWYGWGQFYEAHLQSDGGFNFSGACFYGSPIPTLGHNEYLGWSYTVNDPDNADAYREVFDDPDQPLNYRYADGYRRAIQWHDTIRVRAGNRLQLRQFTFLKTHHGPITQREDKQTFLAAKIARLFDLDRIEQGWELIRAKNYRQWRKAAGHCAIPLFNIVYADCEGNFGYVYGGSLPIRRPSYNWTRPVDGSDPNTEWQGFFGLDQLPQVFNPKSGYVQNCNSTPFTTTDCDNPRRADFPAYIMEDGHDDKRRAKMSRRILHQAHDLTFEQLQRLAFDTTLYWPLTELPKYERDFRQLQQQFPKQAERIRPYWEHLQDWNCRATPASTQATLCVAWYEQLYGFGKYPGETLLPEYRHDRRKQLVALAAAAETLQAMHGGWKVPWGEMLRIQRLHDMHDVQDAAYAFSRWQPSLPCCGAPGPLGIVFTVYSTPPIPLLRPNRYAVVGTCYLAAIEFGPRIKAASIVPYGSSADPRSANYFDQAQQFSQRKLKRAWFYLDEVRAHAVRTYHPGQETAIR